MAINKKDYVRFFREGQLAGVGEKDGNRYQYFYTLARRNNNGATGLYLVRSLLTFVDEVNAAYISRSAEGGAIVCFAEKEEIAKAKLDRDFADALLVPTAEFYSTPGRGRRFRDVKVW